MITIFFTKAAISFFWVIFFDRKKRGLANKDRQQQSHNIKLSVSSSEASNCSEILVAFHRHNPSIGPNPNNLQDVLEPDLRPNIQYHYSIKEKFFLVKLLHSLI